MKRIYKNKNYWIGEAKRQSIKLPSERFRELMEDCCYPTIKKEIPVLQKMLDNLRKYNESI